MKKSAKTVNTQYLVVGDLMLDRSWICSSRVGSTSQTHGGVLPQKRFHSSAIDYRCGGAALAAFALSHFPNSEVHLLSAEASTSDLETLTSCGLTSSPATYVANEDKVLWHTLKTLPAGKPITTTKFRIYGKFPGQAPKLQFRFDQDPPDGIKIDHDLPHTLAVNYDAILISDFAKGVVTTELLRELHKRYPKAIWAIDSKNPNLIEFLRHLLNSTPFTVFVNRSEAEYLYRSLPKAYSPKADWGGLDGKREIILPRLLELARDCSRCLTRGVWTLVVKLDESGAIAVESSPRTASTVSSAIAKPVANADGIGAGDFFAAGYLHHLTENRGSPARDALNAGVSAASCWIQHCNSDFWQSKHHVLGGLVVRDCPWPSDIDIPALANVSVNLDGPNDLAHWLQQLTSERTYPNFMRSAGNRVLTISTAKGFLGDFLTVDPNRGRMLTKFANDLRNYFAAESETRPLNCFVWAHPGAGKSFFTREAAKFAGASFEEINISQLNSSSELTSQLAYIAGQKHRRLVLLLDEVETKIRGSHIFSQLLAPLWDGIVMTDRGPSNLGRSFVSVLVASDTSFANAQECLKAIEKGGDKGADLVSRINGEVITLTNPSDTDRSYMAASLIRRTFGKDVSEVHFGLLDFIVKANLEPRRIEQLLGRLKPPRDGRVLASDWGHILSGDSVGASRFIQGLTDDVVRDCLGHIEMVTIRD